MKSKLALFARLFVPSSLLFALATALVMLLDDSGTGLDDPGHLLQQSALAGALFGGWMTLWMGTGQILATRKLSRDASALSVRQTRELTLAEPPERALQLAVEAVQGLEKGRVFDVNPSSRRVVARKGVSWRSWGEVIAIEVRAAEPAGSILRISSRPRLSTTLVDWGSNLRNVTELCSSLSGKGRHPVQA